MTSQAANCNMVRSTDIPITKSHVVADSESGSSCHLRRPLSAYNIFFQLERKRILSGTSDEPFTMDETIEFVNEQQAKRNTPQPRRPHRKTHGKVSFKDMARTLANRWKVLNPNDKEIFDMCAVSEKKRYLIEKKEIMKKQQNMNTTTISTTEEAEEVNEIQIITCEMSRNESCSVITSDYSESQSIATTSEDSSKKTTTSRVVNDECDDDDTFSFIQAQQELSKSTRMIQLQKSRIQRMEQQVKLFEMRMIQQEQMLRTTGFQMNQQSGAAYSTSFGNFTQTPSCNFQNNTSFTNARKMMQNRRRFGMMQQQHQLQYNFDHQMNMMGNDHNIDWQDNDMMMMSQFQQSNNNMNHINDDMNLFMNNNNYTTIDPFSSTEFGITSIGENMPCYNNMENDFDIGLHDDWQV